MTTPRLTLRDLFWLTFLAALAVGWTVDRAAATKTILDFGQPPFPATPTTIPTPREKIMAQLARFTDDELLAAFHGQATGLGWPGQEIQFLNELARRRMVEPLREAFERADRSTSTFDEFRTAALLTALRRADGRPDPVRVQAELVNLDDQGRPSERVMVRVRLENVDPDETAILIFEDDSGDGRREHWRIELTAPDGKQLPTTGIWSLAAGLTTYSHNLAPGRAGNLCTLDPRKYVGRPPSGRYKLQVFRSNEQIIDEPNLNGFIAWKSAPIAVEVTNVPAGRPFSARLLMAVLALAAAVVLFARRDQAQRFRRRDRVFLIVATVISAAWAWDQTELSRRIELARPHNQAMWTLRASDES